MKKLLSLFTILCCIFTFASFPALAVEASAQVVSFFDNFETETDNVPDNWEVYNNQINTSVSVVTENGNKFLRMTKSDSAWGGEIMASTKANLVSLPTTGSKILVKMKMRGSDMRSGVSARHSIRLAYPKATNGAAHADDGGNEYLVWAMRMHSSASASFCYPANANNLLSDSGYLTAEKTWYDVTAVVDFEAKSINYVVGNSTQGYKRFTANITNTSLGEVELIDNITIKLTNGTQNFYTDIDDVSVSYLPKALSFEDTFENVATGSAPENWVDRAGVSTISVMEETGNKFVRVTKPANTTGVPQVTTKDGVINIPMKDQYGKGIIVEAKIRQQNEIYRTLLMLNSPDLATDTQLGANYSTPFYIHTTKDVYFMPGYVSNATKLEKLNEWVHYRAVIIPGEEHTEIRHYFNDSHRTTTYVSASAMPEIFNAQALYNIAFVWRHASQNPSAATDTGYMDFDDIKVYEMKAPIYEVKVTNAQGTEIEEIENGTITVDAKVVNNGTGRTVDVIGALYTKVGDSWKLTETKKAINPDENDYLYAFAWRTGTGSLTLNVTDAPNQMIKVFVWNRTADLDGDSSAFETSLRTIPVCEPIVID